LKISGDFGYAAGASVFVAASGRSSLGVSGLTEAIWLSSSLLRFCVVMVNAPGRASPAEAERLLRTSCPRTAAVAVGNFANIRILHPTYPMPKRADRENTHPAIPRGTVGGVP